ncbi:MAG: hypothetical protein AAF514_17890, partial [Verrucomicrobiota bacterium]
GSTQLIRETVVAAAGGYAIDLDPGTYDLHFIGPGIYELRFGLAIDDTNVKVDIVDPGYHPPTESPMPLFAITRIVREEGNLRVFWTSVAGRTYQAQHSDDLQTWYSAGEPVPSAGEETSTLLNAEPTEKHYFRIAEASLPAPAE